MQFGLMTRGQYELGDDMQQRFAELAEQVRLADRLGFASLTKGSLWRDNQDESRASIRMRFP
ncbi:MAG: LLM class flavin-dependent oxidoreductase, partial [Alphaproteobacteria bacterium]|nr:LLM class flavin-dependent oxidoreductase [Alphaproteobacteria bacterium]